MKSFGIFGEFNGEDSVEAANLTLLSLALLGINVKSSSESSLSMKTESKGDLDGMYGYGYDLRAPCIALEIMVNWLGTVFYFSSASNLLFSCSIKFCRRSWEMFICTLR